MPDKNVFSVLPTEICYSILSYLGSEDAAAFANCSQHCYIVAFPRRFREFHSLKLNDDNYARLLKPFTGRRWLAPVRQYIRAMSFTIFFPDTLQAFRSAAAMFPNLRSITVKIFSFNNLERNIYVALFAFLSTLPFYDEIDHFAFIWAGTEERWYNNMEDYRRLPESEQTTAGLYNWTMKPYPKAWNLLGPFISEDEFSQRVQEIRLPKNLKSYQIDTGFARQIFMEINNRSDCAYLIPVINTTRITALHVHRAQHLFTATLDFPTVKTLTLGMAGQTITYHNHFCGSLHQQFPNLETLVITHAYCDSIGSIYWFQNLHRLTRLEISWLKIDYRYETNRFEEFVRQMVDGNLPNLRKCKLVGILDTPVCRNEVAVTCTITKNKTKNTEIGTSSWDYHFEGDLDFEQYEHDSRCWHNLSATEYSEDTDPDYIGSDSEGEEHASDEPLEMEGSEFSEDSEYPDTGDELYPIDTDEFSDDESADAIDEPWDTEDISLPQPLEAAN